jgi:hypothetical protein
MKEIDVSLNEKYKIITSGSILRKVSKFQELSILQLLLDEKYVFFCNTFLKKPKRLEQ